MRSPVPTAAAPRDTEVVGLPDDLACRPVLAASAVAEAPGVSPPARWGITVAGKIFILGSAVSVLVAASAVAHRHPRRGRGSGPMVVQCFFHAGKGHATRIVRE